MKHFVKKHKHHFGLWALSGVIFVISTLWWGHLNQQDNLVTDIVYNTVAPATSTARLSLSQDQASSSPPVSVVETKNVEITSDVISTASIEKNNLLSAQENASSTASEENKILVTFIITVADDTSTFKLGAQKGNTVYEAMLILATKYNLDIKFKEFAGIGAMVESINSVGNNAQKNKFWIYYINGALAKAGVSSVKINKNDVITWNYEAGKE